jgi:hypothetical protein
MEYMNQKSPKITVFQHNRRSQFGIYLEEGQGHFRNEDLTTINELDGALELFDKSGNVLHRCDCSLGKYIPEGLQWQF